MDEGTRLRGACADWCWRCYRGSAPTGERIPIKRWCALIGMLLTILAFWFIVGWCIYTLLRMRGR